MQIPITVGSMQHGSADAVLDAGRFNRHTFWCGQSGSGKTYALGVVLEQLLLNTGLPLVVFDPNSDFVGLGTTRDGASPQLAQQIAKTDIRVFRPGRDGTDRLAVRYLDMDLSSRAAVLRLDPIHDSEEFFEVLQLEAKFGPQDSPELVETLTASDRPEHRRLVQRIRNIGLLNWDLWARGGTGVEDVIAERPDATVLDFGSFRTPDEPHVAALAIVDSLWRDRERRAPVLLVIDEAHNLCPAKPTSVPQQRLVDRLIQIAAEGRKYGLWLLLSTQRPSKLHPQVLSQCDNLCLMKTNSPADLDQLGSYFGAVPTEDLHLAKDFGLGEALFAGGIAGGTKLVRMGERLTVEGGFDVQVPARRASLS